MSQKRGLIPCPHHMRAYCQTLAIDITGKEQAEIEALYWRAIYSRLAAEVRQGALLSTTSNHTLERAALTADADDSLPQDLMISWTWDQIC